MLYLKHEHLVVDILKHLQDKTMGTLISENGAPNISTIRRYPCTMYFSYSVSQMKISEPMILYANLVFSYFFRRFSNAHANICAAYLKREIMTKTRLSLSAS